ncbi:uncharacterized protein LOC125373269 [Haliotis rufescens]|uniref:uncharacterized protein LOC125373269 n=1 Tax=Haliotis rufescens TaxID=6454 RepID=UPI00201EA7E4|nr:uncharacterized protein LOC125373269 [Haliotis rufescens]
MEPPQKKRSHESHECFDNENDSLRTPTITFENWPRFLVISTLDGTPLKLNPFAVEKAVQGIAGDVEDAKRLRSGCLLIKCRRHKQAICLLSIKSLANVPVVVSPHRSLNSSKGIVRDRGRFLADMTEDEILEELHNQNVISVKRFSSKRNGEVIKTNTYLFTFGLPKIPTSIRAGYCNINVDMYIPNPLRCYKCEQYGHGSRTCVKQPVCHRCAGNCVDSADCNKDPLCVSCGGNHFSSSKECPTFKCESKIVKLKHERNISFPDAKKIVMDEEQSPRGSYSVAVSRPISQPAPQRVKQAVSCVAVGCQTDYTWTKTDAPEVISLSADSTIILETASSQTSHDQSPSQLPPTLQAEKSVKQVVKNKNKPKSESSKKYLSGRVSKGSDNKIQIFNKFGSLEDMDVSDSSHQRAHSLSPLKKGRGRSPIKLPNR